VSHLIPRLCLPIVLAIVGFTLLPSSPAFVLAEEKATPDRSPVDLVLTPDEQFLITANQTSHTISLVKLASGEVVSELPCGERPSAVMLTPDSKRVLVSATFGGELRSFTLENGTLKVAQTLKLGFEPRGIAVSPDGKLAYVALTTAHAIAVVDLTTFQLVEQIKCGRWPRYLTITADGKKLAVGANGDGGVAIIDTVAKKQLFIEDFIALNMGQMQISADGQFVYMPWMVYRHNPITPGNIRLGWVLASRIARVRLDEHVRREAISLDPQGLAVSDPHGLALSPNEEWMVCSASGTQELLVYKLPGLPFQDYGGPGDHIDAKLLKDGNRFFRIPLGGRPMAVRYSKDGQRVYVANYLLNAVQVVEPSAKKIVRTIELGGPKEPSLARQGEAIFHDGKRSLDQWYSCHSCHYEGHTNAVTMDTQNDGRFGNFKTVLSLRNVTKTGPWTWHGWQKDLTVAMRKSLVDSMLGKQPTEQDVKALVAYLETLKHPTNPYRTEDGGFSDAAKRGEVVFKSDKANCNRCHNGEFYSDGKLHDVGTGERGDVYSSYNPPSLVHVFDKIKYLHDGRAKSLRDVFTGAHDPNKFVGRGALTEQELSDLLEYLKSL